MSGGLREASRPNYLGRPTPPLAHWGCRVPGWQRRPLLARSRAARWAPRTAPRRKSGLRARFWPVYARDFKTRGRYDSEDKAARVPCAVTALRDAKIGCAAPYSPAGGRYAVFEMHLAKKFPVCREPSSPRPFGAPRERSRRQAADFANFSSSNGFGPKVIYGAKRRTARITKTIFTRTARPGRFGVPENVQKANKANKAAANAAAEKLPIRAVCKLLATHSSCPLLTAAARTRARPKTKQPQQQLSLGLESRRRTA